MSGTPRTVKPPEPGTAMHAETLVRLISQIQTQDHPELMSIISQAMTISQANQVVPPVVVSILSESLGYRLVAEANAKEVVPDTDGNVTQPSNNEQPPEPHLAPGATMELMELKRQLNETRLNLAKLAQQQAKRMAANKEANIRWRGRKKKNGKAKPKAKGKAPEQHA